MALSVKAVFDMYIVHPNWSRRRNRPMELPNHVVHSQDCTLPADR